MRVGIFLIIISFFASMVGVFFILNYPKTIDYISEEEIQKEKIPTEHSVDVPVPEDVRRPPEDLFGSSIENQELIEKSQEIITEAKALIAEAQKFIEEEKEKRALAEEALEKSSQIKGIYTGAANNPAYFKNLLEETELNGIVIDVKEAYGINLPLSLKKIIEELHQKDVWVIARIVVFRDSSLVQVKPEWYLGFATSTVSTATTSDIWQDRAGQYWLDPKNEEVQNYIIEFSKRVIDFGFNELQFDYIRFPEGYQGSEEKYKVIGDFFLKLSDSLKNYKPAIILSVDLFGYIATQLNSYEIGQRLIDAARVFDYLSFMLYPSHFYGGFKAEEIQYSYPEVVEYPYEVVYHSILSAKNYLSFYNLKTKIRPWLQDFNLMADTQQGIVYDAEKVRAQIEAAENASSSGWLLWNSSNIYTREAFKF